MLTCQPSRVPWAYLDLREARSAQVAWMDGIGLVHDVVGGLRCGKDTYRRSVGEVAGFKHGRGENSNERSFCPSVGEEAKRQEIYIPLNQLQGCHPSSGCKTFCLDIGAI